MKKLSLLLVLGLLVLAAFLWLLFRSDKVQTEPDILDIDVSETDFTYDVAICDKYFGLVECIINNDSDVRYTRQMRIDLKNEVRQMQENWRSLSSEELFNMCSNELAKFDNEIMAEKLKLINCSRE